MTNAAYKLARGFIGTKEIVGRRHNPIVVQWFADVGHSWVNDDETPWCAAFVGSMLKRGGYRFTGKLNARSYADTPSNTKVRLLDAEEGDIVVFERGNDGWSGHVAFFVRQTDKSILCLGGNQNNEVNEKWYGKNRLIGVYRPKPTAPVVSRPKPGPSTPRFGFWSLLVRIFSRKRK